MNAELITRLTIEADIPQLVELRIQQLAAEGYPETQDIRKELNLYFTNGFQNQTLVCWVATHHKAIVATAGLCFYQLPPTFSNPTGKIGYITNMFTVETYRRQGIASDLLGELLKEAKARNYSAVKLHASDLGKRVYVRAGFADSDGYMALKL